MYKKDINERNPLGTGGKLIKAYADLLEKLWNGKSNSLAPWNLKKVIGSFA